MLQIAAALDAFLLQHVQNVLTRDPSAGVRLGLLGPPNEALAALLDRLTTNETTAWTPTAGAPIPVLLVTYAGNPSAPSLTMSGRCRWDFAVTVRNSSNRVLILIAPDAADRIPESLANTTEIFDGLTRRPGRRWPNDVIWKYLVDRISTVRGVLSEQVAFALQQVSRQATNLAPLTRDRIVWETADVLLQSSLGLSSTDALALASGFPAIGQSGASLQDAADVLDRLAKQVGRQGITPALESIKNSQFIQVQSLAQPVEDLRLHLLRTAPSGMGFQEAPAIYYRPAIPPPSWWGQLDYAVLTSALDELTPPTPGRLTLRCDNQLCSGNRFVVVANRVELRAVPPNSLSLSRASFTRRIGRTASATALAPDPADQCFAVDSAPPSHDRPINYTSSAPTFTDGTLRVISLDTFACRGLAWVPNSEENPAPSRARGQQAWAQEILLSHSGNTDVRILHCSGADSVVISRLDNGEGPWTRQVQPRSHETPFVLDIEDGSSYGIRVVAPGNLEIASWSIKFIVQEVGETPPTRYSALVTTHQHAGKRVSQPHVIDTPLRRIEQAYLQTADSWKPILACWPTPDLGSLLFFWQDPRLGSDFPQLDPRPALIPPRAVIDAREAIRNHLLAASRPIGEIHFDDPALISLAEPYLAEYGRWLEADPDATWLDTIAVHAAERNAQVGGFLAYAEPSVMLISPLHPLRIAWHCCAQQSLASALNRTCPAAGLFDPSSCPDFGLWSLRQGQDPSIPRAFLAVTCEEPHWSVLLNRTYLGQNAIEMALKSLAALGIRTRGLPGGFSRSQSYDSVQEVAKLLPARATLRIAIVGDAEQSTACAEGVLSWASDNCNDDYNEAVTPSNVDVFDMRGSTEPTPEQLAMLAEETSERARWYRVSQLPPESPQDLVLLDQLGTDAPRGDKGAARTATSPAALIRIHTREDSRGGLQLSESRIGRAEPAPPTLSATLAGLCVAFENLTLRDEETSQFAFRPVQQAIGSRLYQSTYVAVTSSQIDPACIIRGTRSQQGYLWDYELPGALRGDEERAGYYLIAKPTEAMQRAISQSAQLVAPTPPPVTDLLDEISRRGIPILKRLASGGSQARGELGLLLAVRFLQDSFRAGSGRVGLPVWRDRCIHLILAVDPYETSFDGLRRALQLKTSEQRPDLLVLAIRMPSTDERIRIKITPVEVKFRQGQMSGSEMRDALEQASTFAMLLDALWVQPLPSQLWTVCSSALLGQVLELAFRIYADPAVHGKTTQEWTRVQEEVISAVLNQKADITVNAKGSLFVFDESQQSTAIDTDADNRFDTAVISHQDSGVLLAGSGSLSSTAEQSIALLDFSFPDCGQPSALGPSEGGAQPQVSATAAETGRVSDSNRYAEAGQTPTPPAETPAPVTQSVEILPSDDDHTIPGATPALIPPEIRQAVRNGFQGFIGNEAAVKRITNDLLRALIDRPPYLSKNFLFTGQPSTGKTEISRRIAAVLRLPFVKLDGRGLRSRERLFELIDGELSQQNLTPSQVNTQASLPVMQYPALVVFIDEVHLVPRPIQESLLTMLEAADRSVTLADRIALMNRATFLFATTRASDVDAAFRSRCSEVQLKEYSREQVADMVRLKFPHTWPVPVYLAIAQLGRRVPRIALELARELETAITVSEDPSLTVQQHLEEVRKARELDELGLTLVDLEYLSHLQRENRPVGEQTVLNMMGTVDRDRIVDEIEPFLRNLGFIRFGPRGREITDQGKDYLVSLRRRNPAQ